MAFLTIKIVLWIEAVIVFLGNISVQSQVFEDLKILTIFLVWKQPTWNYLTKCSSVPKSNFGILDVELMSWPVHIEKSVVSNENLRCHHQQWYYQHLPIGHLTLSPHNIVIYSKITPPIYHSMKSSHVKWPMSQVATCDRRGVTGSHLWHGSLNMWRFYTVIYCVPKWCHMWQLKKMALTYVLTFLSKYDEMSRIIIKCQMVKTDKTRI